MLTLRVIVVLMVLATSARTASAQDPLSIFTSDGRQFFNDMNKAVARLSGTPTMDRLRLYGQRNLIPAGVQNDPRTGESLVVIANNLNRSGYAAAEDWVYFIPIFPNDWVHPNLKFGMTGEIAATLTFPATNQLLLWNVVPLTDPWKTIAAAYYLQLALNSDGGSPIDLTVDRLWCYEAAIQAGDAVTAGKFSAALKGLNGRAYNNYVMLDGVDVYLMDESFEKPYRKPASDIEEIFRRKLYIVGANLVRLQTLQQKLGYLKLYLASSR